jgi:hypothetical protein
MTVTVAPSVAISFFLSLFVLQSGRPCLASQPLHGCVGGLLHCIGADRRSWSLQLETVHPVMQWRLRSLRIMGCVFCDI